MAKRLRCSPVISARYGGDGWGCQPVCRSGAMQSIEPGMTPSASLREPARPARLDRALERRPRVHPRQPGGQIRIRPELVEYFGHFADKTHLDVGAGKRVPDKELAPLQRTVDIAEMIGDLAVDARIQRAARLLQPADIEVEHQRQH